MHVGDQVIGQLGELIASRLPPGGLAARISGDRFAVLLPIGSTTQCASPKPCAAAQNYWARCTPSTRTAGLDQHWRRAAIQTGAPRHRPRPRAAEIACKSAKHRGRNRVAMYEADDTSLARRFADMTAAARLRDAIAAGSAAPRCTARSCRSGSRGPAAALRVAAAHDRRARHHARPRHFPVGRDRYQLMPTIDRWVVSMSIEALQPSSACSTAARAVFAINFSGQSLSDDGFADFLINTIHRSGIDPAACASSSPKTRPLANPSRAEVLMRRLRRSAAAWRSMISAPACPRCPTCGSCRYHAQDRRQLRARRPQGSARGIHGAGHRAAGAQHGDHHRRRVRRDRGDPRRASPSSESTTRRASPSAVHSPSPRRSRSSRSLRPRSPCATPRIGCTLRA